VEDEQARYAQRQRFFKTGAFVVASGASPKSTGSRTARRQAAKPSFKEIKPPGFKQIAAPRTVSNARDFRIGFNLFAQPANGASPLRGVTAIVPQTASSN
jgi:hypothetical protein